MSRYRCIDAAAHDAPYSSSEGGIMQVPSDPVLLKQIGRTYRLVFWFMLVVLGLILIASPGWSASVAADRALDSIMLDQGLTGGTGTAGSR
jgi:hypothetical protein